MEAVIVFVFFPLFDKRLESNCRSSTTFLISQRVCIVSEAVEGSFVVYAEKCRSVEAEGDECLPGGYVGTIGDPEELCEAGLHTLVCGSRL